ncbi:hypothetical protein CWI75_14220 [Kineobactrum sediminis]|uniref:Type 4 fimbrial biogenesis protein PilX N-terminal domain-containing protein n=2 Tax=Kineobactrum sediminis TaxID=1905677 RepID=A0A2N5XZS0_9GAMM|nr:hypothetical protein CWI75_14220 [Kineobactrum sediminis]
MLFLLLLGLIANTVINTSILEFRMAGNDQFREQAFQKARGIANALVAHISHFPVTGGVGYTLCERDAVCDSPTLAVSATAEAVEPGVNVEYRIVRQAPLLSSHHPFRQVENEASATGNFAVALFEIIVEVDGVDVGLGSARVVQGVAIRIASGAG